MDLGEQQRLQCISYFKEAVLDHGGWASEPKLFLNHTSGGGFYWFQYGVVPGLRSDVDQPEWY